jgi:hypothetical protein
MSNDLAYDSRRMAQEHAAASAATDAKARRAHLELAGLYEARIRSAALAAEVEVPVEAA